MVTSEVYLFIFFFKVMTDQQRELFQTMDQQQKVQFIQRLKQEREMKMRQEIKELNEEESDNKKQHLPYCWAVIQETLRYIPQVSAWRC